MTLPLVRRRAARAAVALSTALAVVAASATAWAYFSSLSATDTANLGTATLAAPTTGVAGTATGSSLALSWGASFNLPSTGGSPDGYEVFRSTLNTTVASTSNNVSVTTFTGTGTLNVASVSGFTSPSGTIQVATSAATSVAAGSNGVTVATACPAAGGTLNVASTANFPQAGTINVVTTGGTSPATITYTGTTSTSFTGCVTTGGSGTLSTGNSVGWTGATTITYTGTSPGTFTGAKAVSGVGLLATGGQVIQGSPVGSGGCATSSTTVSTSTSCTDSSLNAGTTYYYVIEAVYDNWVSSPDPAFSGATVAAINPAASSCVGQTASNNTVAVPYPSGVVANDLLLFVYANLTNQSASFGAAGDSTGWTPVSTAPSYPPSVGNSEELQAFYGTATASSPVTSGLGTTSGATLTSSALFPSGSENYVGDAVTGPGIASGSYITAENNTTHTATLNQNVTTNQTNQTFTISPAMIAKMQTNASGYAACLIDIKGVSSPALNGTTVFGTASPGVTTLTPSTFSTIAADPTIVLSLVEVATSSGAPPAPSLQAPSGFSSAFTYSGVPGSGAGLGLSVATKNVAAIGSVTSPVWSEPSPVPWAYITVGIS